MKSKSMKSLLTKSAAVMAACFALSAQAGTTTAPSAKGVQPVIEPESDALGFTLETGYETSYYFRGLFFSSNNVFTSLAFTVPVAEKLSFTAGALYTSTVDTDVGGGDFDYSELDLFAALNYDAGFAKFGLAFTNYNFFDTFSGSVDGSTFGFAESPDSTLSDARDIALSVAVPIGSLNLYGTYVYDFRVEGHYAELGTDYTIAVNDWLSIVPSAQIGYNIADYYSYAEVTGVSSGWNHVRAMITAPIKLTKTASLVPYIAVNFALDAREQLNVIEDQNALYGGVKVSVTF
jgi:hypothetical protein